ncbi:phosphate/phosphite/phosphonate ABC transporter substrate-binding protein [Alkalimonas delamerensis]|uniref:Phosphate/phosphite/phosphonate ABC transporter substrate-binding protein n=1 Tax=Alkalimonas delamerensis TaxID=265981 RepID=A0ABT9GQH9_9GAMM|nr:phosphate/phosphite/phosphonate ABC transporter substrate-binding protein [Alkalimonas delamerensis]MDP4529233.1 phosphate/phosphite/phosphonate ABC transporter substrate-binding protein [Alkalimonas delamerensis]
MTIKKLLATLVAVSSFTALPALASAPASCPATLRFADTGIEGMEEMVRTYGEFQQKLTEVLGLEVRFFPVSDRTAAVNALQFNQVDMILAGPSEYAVMRARQPVKMMVGIERTNYGTAFVVHEDSGIYSLQDLKGKRVALKDPGSTTGHIVPSKMLHEAGLNINRDLRLMLLDGARFEALINRDVDAMGSGVRDVERLQERDPNGRYRVIAESDTMPRDIFVARGGIDDSCVAYVSDKMMEHSEALLDAILNPGERRKYRGARFVNDLTEAEYDRITRAYALVGYPLD